MDEVRAIWKKLLDLGVSVNPENVWVGYARQTQRTGWHYTRGKQIVFLGETYDEALHVLECACGERDAEVNENRRYGDQNE